MELIDGDPTERLRARSIEVHNFWKTLDAHEVGWGDCRDEPCAGDREMIFKLEAGAAKMAEEQPQQGGCPKGPHVHTTTRVYAMGPNGEPVGIPPELKRFFEGVFGGGKQG